MLSESSYLTAIYTYCGAAIMIMLCLAWWLGRRWRSSWAVLLVLLAGALLLTPAFPKAGVTTVAPALIAAGFQWATEGIDTAQHALKPLGAACALAVGLTLLLRFTVFRSSKHTDHSGGDQAASDVGSAAESD